VSDKPKVEDWHYCHECQVKRGGVFPKNQMGITVMEGVCSGCGEKKTLIPNNDYHWPKQGKRAWVD